MPERDQKNPASLVYWNDLENDEKLRACSLAAKGLWACHLLPMAKRSTTPGVVVIGTHPSRWDQDLPELLARSVGGSAETIAPLLAELVQSGAASVDDCGRLFNRRMVRDAKTSAARSKAGKQGADATNRKRQTSRQNAGKHLGNDTGKEPGKRVDNSAGKVVGKMAAAETPLNHGDATTIRDGGDTAVRQTAGNECDSSPGTGGGNTIGKSSASSYFSPNGDSLRAKPLQGLAPVETTPPVATREGPAGAPHAVLATGRPSLASRTAALVEARHKAALT